MLSTESHARLIKSLKKLGFVPENGTDRDVWCLPVAHDDHVVATVRVDMELGRIEYPEGTQLGRRTCCNLVDSNDRELTENMVTLDCYIRLLRTGYAPHLITLEKSFRLGHADKGWADLVVHTDESAPEDRTEHLIVECKTHESSVRESEFDRERSKMHRDGGQLMSYWGVAQNTDTLVLYGADPHSTRFGTDNALRILRTRREVFSECRDREQLFRAWDQVFDQIDIFAKPYNREVEILAADHLGVIGKKESDDIYLSILELLRVYSVSDKQNAFMKIINLLIAKVFDETTGDTDFAIATPNTRNRVHGLMFQETEHDTHLTLQQRLLHLYTHGMRDYLKAETFHSQQRFMAMDHDELARLARLTSEFHFVEVYDDDSFLENSKILAGVVKILQGYRFKNENRDQILGDLFERLLNTAIKQESGQFFTPMPIVDFLTDCLPLEASIEQNLRDRKKVKTPSIIDYSCGSGHFIISALEAIHRVLGSIDNPETARLAASGYGWAGDSVYGIEKDYRLAKTTKINTFLNGDGEANIIHADGLDAFTSEKYVGQLRTHLPNVNGRFDYVLANPPYSVDGFVKSVADLGGADIYTLFNDFHHKSTEIETLFIERTAQLLADRGIAALVLPTSVTNGSNYRNMRQFLLRHFRLRAVAYLGSNTFSDTTTSPVLLFLERRDRGMLRPEIREALTVRQDRTTGGVRRPLSAYLARAYPGTSLTDYCDAVHTPAATDAEATAKLEAYAEMAPNFQLTFADLDERARHELLVEVREAELDRIETFIENYDNDVVVITAPSDEVAAERAFLGYKFSNARTKQGIEILPGSPLYNPKDRHDDTKISNVVRRHLTATPSEDAPAGALPKHVEIHAFNDLLDYSPVIQKRGEVSFPYAWSNTAAITATEPFVYLKDLVTFVESTTCTGDYVTVKIGDIKDGRITKTAKTSFKDANVLLAEPSDIFIPNLTPSPAKIVLVREACVRDSAFEVLRATNVEIAQRLHAYLADGQAASFFYAQVAAKLSGFKRSYSRISQGNLGMVMIPAALFEGVPGFDTDLVREPREASTSA